MRIKLIKDIPGYKAGETFFSPIENWHLSFIEKKQTEIGLRDNDLSKYDVKYLLDNGWAEEVKDEIDIEEIRSRRDRKENRMKYNWVQSMSQEERIWFNAFVTVKAVIEKLNGDWNNNWFVIDCCGWQIKYDASNDDFFDPYFDPQYKKGLLPQIKNQETAEKVISLCEPELKVLFNVK